MALFCDIDNLYYCINKRYPSRKLDYEKYIEAVRGDNILMRAFAYGTEINDNNKNFKNRLKMIGFETKYKKNIPGSKGEQRINDWNVGISMEIVRLIERVDCIIIGSADPRLTPLAEWIRERGVRCVIFACGISKELKIASNDYIEIKDDLLEIKKDIING